MFYCMCTGSKLKTFRFYLAFQNAQFIVVPYLNPWPLPRSILILDNAKIHMYRELEDLVHSRGALLFCLPPYSPQLNPIKVAFGLLKHRIQNYPLSFRFDIRRTLKVLLTNCFKNDAQGLYRHCGYSVGALNVDNFMFNADI